jgi:transposase InsO family protein
MREMSVTEQRYKAVLAVIGDGRTVGEVARDWGISRRTMHRWLARYEGDGLEGLGNRSHRPAHCPHQTSPAVEAMVLEMRRAHPYWGARRIAFELVRKRVEAAPSESAVYRCPVRAAVIDPALKTYGVPAQVLTDNGKVFTGRFAQPPVEVLFDRICRENGVDHILTQPRTPTTTGKIERFHRTLRIEFNTRQMFKTLKTAQGALDEWVSYYNTQRPHQSLGDATPESRFQARGEPRSETTPRRPERNGEQWVCRKVASNGVVSVGYQQVSVGRNYSGSACDVLVTDGLLQFWIGSELLKTVARTSAGSVRKMHANGTAPRRR